MGLGVELIIDGNMDVPGSWSSFNASVSGGKGLLNVIGSNSGLFQTILVNGTDYRSVFDITGLIAGGAASDVAVANDSGNSIYDITSNGNHSFDFTHSNVSGNLIWRARNADSYAEIDNVSAKEILPDPTVGTLSLGTTAETTQELTWTAANVNGGSAIAGYDIYKDGVLEKSVGVVLSDTVTGLTPSTEYDWTIKAINSDDTAGESAFSNEVTATTSGGVSTTVTTTTWTDSISAGVIGHKVYRDTVPSTGEIEIADVGMGVQVWEDSTALLGVDYEYEVQAYSATDETTDEQTNVNVKTVTTLAIPTGITLTEI